jgi:hypothetical protein
MLHLLIDTSVWLDLAKDHRQQAALVCLEQLLEDGQAALIVPQIIVEEFARNKDRVTRESQQSLTALFRRVRDAVDRFGDDDAKPFLIDQLSEIDLRVSTSDGALGAVARIETLFARSFVEETSDAAKLRAAERSLSGRAPFHRNRNAMADAVIFEHYCEAADALIDPDRSVFVTHNTKDFSAPAGDSREPHPELSGAFDDDSSVFTTNLAEVLGEFAPELLEEAQFETDGFDRPRKLSEILEAMAEFHDKIWYGRHWGWRNSVEAGRTKIVERGKLPVGAKSGEYIVRDIYEGAVAAAKEMEAKYEEDLGPWTDFEWGMLNGKLSALRWLLGDEWDMLDT